VSEVRVGEGKEGEREKGGKVGKRRRQKGDVSMRK
jgi:hypothetical protein